MRTPTPYEIRVAMETALFEELAPAHTAGEIVLVQPGMPIAPEMTAIQVVHTLNPGEMQDGELAGRDGVCPRLGVYIVMFSCPVDTAKLAQAEKLAGDIEKAFYRREVPVDDCAILCGEPYVTNTGETPDNRLAVTVTIPWWTWAGAA